MRTAIIAMTVAGMLAVNASAGVKTTWPTMKHKEGTMRLTSPAFTHGGSIPALYSGLGRNLSPALQWTGVPAGTVSLALICDDPDAPGATWVHWVVYNLPPSCTGLPEGMPREPGIPTGGMQGVNSSDTIGYDGPYPPTGTHRYFFKLYALDTVLALEKAARKPALERAMKGHIIDEARLMGTFTR